MKENKGYSSGLSFGTILFLIFLVLKLTNTGTVATWSWLWVTSPLWIPFGLVIVVLLIAVLWKLIK